MRNHHNRRCVLALTIALTVAIGCGKKAAESPSKEPAAPAQPTTEPSPAAASGAAAETTIPANEVLQRMAAAYREAPSYGDAGRLRLTFTQGGQSQPSEYGLVTAMTRPNQFRFHSERADVVCDGKTFHGFILGMSGAVLERPAPAMIDMKTLLEDVVLANQFQNGPEQFYSSLPIPMVLLFADDSLKTLTHTATDTRALPPAKIDGSDCHRIEITRPDGKGVFWIDQKTYALRRFEYPVEMLRTMMGLSDDADVSLVAEFTDAQLGGPVDPNAFRFEAPPEVKVVSKLVPADVELLGKRSKDFIFVGMDGKPVMLTSLAGKTVVMEFWATWCGPCRETLPLLQNLYEKYRDNDAVRFMAVSVDQPNTPNADLEKMFKDLGITVPIYRDSERHADSAFAVSAIPTSVILGPNGVVQAYHRIESAQVVAQLAANVETVVGGKDAFPETLRAFEQTTSEFRRLFDEMIRRDLFIDPMALLTSAGQRAEPKHMRLDRLWTCAAMKAPGNILVVSDGDAPPRILVVDESRAVVELDTSGSVVARHELGLPPEEPVAFVRTAVGRDAARHYVASAPGAQRFHLFDDAWKLVASFPAEAPKELHAGIGDVQIADLTGDGTLEVLAGYRGEVGVKAVSLSGVELWSERSVADVFKMAVGEPEAEGRRRLFCTNNQVTLAALDGQGKAAGRVEIPDRLLYWIAAADLDRDGRTELCGFAAPRLGENLALGLSADGQLTGNCELPNGLPGPSVELATPAWLKPGEPGQWVLVGADGSIHVVSATMGPIDHFNQGELVMGVAFAQIDGKPALLVATRGKVEAWSVSWPDK